MDLKSLQVWFIPGSHPFTAKRCSGKWPTIAPDRPRIQHRVGPAGPSRLQAVVTSSESILEGAAKPMRARLHRRDLLDAHILAREDVDRGLRALQKPMLHLHTSSTATFPGRRSTWTS